MGRLESWLARHIPRPRFKITESIKSGLQSIKATAAGGTDLADVVRIENENRSLRKEIAELQHIITEFKTANLDRVQQASFDEALRQLAASDSVGVQLKNRLAFITIILIQATEALAGDNKLKVEVLLLDARRTANIGVVFRGPEVPRPRPDFPSSVTFDARFKDNIEAVSFDDPKPRIPDLG